MISLLQVAEAVGLERLAHVLREFCEDGGSVMICTSHLQTAAFPFALAYRMELGKLRRV